MKTDSGVRRCDCVRGAALRETDAARAEGRFTAPVISEERALAAVEMLSGCLSYFPPVTSPLARAAIANEIRGMCASGDEANWLVGRMAKLYQNWPGTREMRIVYCSKHRPLDGFEMMAGVSDFYPEGIPSENPSLPAAEMKFLPPSKGEAVSAAESINETVLALAVAKDMRNVRRRVDVPDIPILPPGQRITQADIDSALNRNRERIAKEQLHGNP